MAKFYASRSSEFRPNYTGFDSTALEKLDHWLKDWLIEALPLREDPKSLISANDLDQETLDKIHVRFPNTTNKCFF